MKLTRPERCTLRSETTFRKWKLFKNDEKCFYFTLKGPFVLKTFKFCLDVLVMLKNSLIRKISLILKFMTSQPGKQTIAIHILPNISRSRGYQTMKFDQLIEYNTGLDKLRARWRACRQHARKKVFACTTLRARKSIKTPLSITRVSFKVASCFFCLKTNNIWCNKICHS